jgi:hypothetical protein
LIADTAEDRSDTGAAGTGVDEWTGVDVVPEVDAVIDEATLELLSAEVTDREPGDSFE